MVPRRRAAPLALALVVLAGGCADPEDRASTASTAGAAAEVEVFGRLDAVHAGDGGGEVRLRRFEGVSDLYALGALEGFRGEVTVAGGVPVLSFGEGQAVRTVRGLDAWGEEAALLVAARVPVWRRAPLEGRTTLEQLEEALAARARASALDPEGPFPFTVYGTVEHLEVHVRAGAPGAFVRRTYDRAEAVLVGFYSTKHAGVFTPAGRRVHVHALVPGDLTPEVSGHVDAVVLGAGAVLAVPLRLLDPAGE